MVALRSPLAQRTHLVRGPQTVHVLVVEARVACQTPAIAGQRDELTSHARLALGQGREHASQRVYSAWLVAVEAGGDDQQRAALAARIAAELALDGDRDDALGALHDVIGKGIGERLKRP